MNNKFVKMLFIAIFCSMFAATAFADIQADQEQSKKMGLQINLVKQEIKTIKARMKVEPTNAELSQQIADKNNELSKLKSDKKIVDANIKAQKAADKAEKAARKAQQKADAAAEKAERTAAERAAIR